MQLPLGVEAGFGGAGVETTTTLEVSGKFKTGKPITMMAMVEPADAQGVVEFRSGDLLLGTVRVGNGSAGIVTQALGAGEHALTATFVPDDPDAFAGSESKAKEITVKAPPKSRVWVSGKLNAKKVDVGNPATVKVTVRGWTEAPEGTVEIRDGDEVVASGDLTVNGRTGTARIQLPKMAPGQYRMSVHYPDRIQPRRGSSSSPGKSCSGTGSSNRTRIGGAGVDRYVPTEGRAATRCPALGPPGDRGWGKMGGC